MNNTKFEIVWSYFAEKQLDEIFDYYKSRAGIRVARKLINGIINAPNELLFQPLIGQEEELLKNREINHYGLEVHRFGWQTESLPGWNTHFLPQISRLARINLCESV